MSKFNEAYAEPVTDIDGGKSAVSAELYTREEAAALFSSYTGEDVSTADVVEEWAHFHGELYDDEFVNTWWRSSENSGGNTPMVDKYKGKKGARKLWVY